MSCDTVQGIICVARDLCKTNQKHKPTLTHCLYQCSHQALHEGHAKMWQECGRQQAVIHGSLIDKNDKCGRIPLSSLLPGITQVMRSLPEIVCNHRPYQNHCNLSQTTKQRTTMSTGKDSLSHVRYVCPFPRVSQLVLFKLTIDAQQQKREKLQLTLASTINNIQRRVIQNYTHPDSTCCQIALTKCVQIKTVRVTKNR